MKEMHHTERYKIDIPSVNETIMADEGDILAEKILQAGIPLSLYCSQKGLCGKCFVEILDGKLPPLKEREKVFITQKGLNQNHRLSCLYRIQSDIRLRIPLESMIQEVPILHTGVESPVELNPAIKKFHLKLKKPEIGLPYSFQEAVENYFQKKLSIPLPLLKKLPGNIEKGWSWITAAVYNDEEILSLEPGHTVNNNFGIAIDLGTTTVVVELINLNTGETLDIETARNSQMTYGSDIMSRISFAVGDPKNAEELRRSILKTLNGMIGQVLTRNKISRSSVYEIVIAGNTAMNHLLLGLPVKSLALSPYQSVFSCLPELSSVDLKFKINRHGKVYISPNIKSFVGGDVSAGLAASDLENRKGNLLFVDLGTNGEIVLKTEEGFLATSTAAGPAFEGMNISCGMLALPGAIYRAEYKNQLVFSTIKNKPVLGICGTGLIDFIAIFLDEGKITPKGQIKDDAQRIRISDNISITQKDVREMQLAIAAIKCGIKMILLKRQLQFGDLDGIFIAGAFGNYLNIENSMRIGLLPRIDKNKVHFIGNSSIAGAKGFLLSGPTRKRIESLVKKIQFFSLASDPLFQKHFIEAIEFQKQSL